MIFHYCRTSLIVFISEYHLRDEFNLGFPKLNSGHWEKLKFGTCSHNASVISYKRAKGNLHKHIVPLAIWNHLFLEFWLVDTWLFTQSRDQRAVTCLENVQELNIRWGKKLDFQLSHTQPLQQFQASGESRL